MGIVPEERGFSARHPAVTTVLVIILIAALGTGLKLAQMKYFPAQQQEFKAPVFLNESFDEVDSHFNTRSNLTTAQQDELFSNNYRFNVVKWTCRPLNCEMIIGLPTLKLICQQQGFAEDVRVSMKNDCTNLVGRPEVTVVFQLVSRTSGEYYLGRSGRTV
jgi:hypothetical protein